MIPEHKRAVLVVDIPEHNLQVGDVGTVVHIYRDGAAYELEFFTLDGHTVNVVTVESNQVRPVNRYDIMHVRELSAQG